MGEHYSSYVSIFLLREDNYPTFNLADLFACTIWMSVSSSQAASQRTAATLRKCRWVVVHVPRGAGSKLIRFREHAAIRHRDSSHCTLPVAIGAPRSACEIDKRTATVQRSQLDAGAGPRASLCFTPQHSPPSLLCCSPPQSRRRLLQCPRARMTLSRSTLAQTSSTTGTFTARGTLHSPVGGGARADSLKG